MTISSHQASKVFLLAVRCIKHDELIDVCASSPNFVRQKGAAIFFLLLCSREAFSQRESTTLPENKIINKFRQVLACQFQPAAVIDGDIPGIVIITPVEGIYPIAPLVLAPVITSVLLEDPYGRGDSYGERIIECIVRGDLRV